MMPDRRALRNWLKGQPSHSQRGQSASWKKDTDPAVPADAKLFWTALDVIKWTLFSSWWRVLVRRLVPASTRCFYSVDECPGVRGLVALTIDDCFCRQSSEACSMISPVQGLLARFGAKATFFLTLAYSEGAWRERQIADVIAHGHELANHCAQDREYDHDTAESFKRDLDATDAFIQRMSGGGRATPSRPRRAKSPERSLGAGSGSAPKWFRAPSASLSDTMSEVLERKGYTHVLTDSYANDCHVPLPRWIAWCMCRRATHGSILVIHMPERGFREWDYTAIESILARLQAKGLKSVTLSELAAAAAAAQPAHAQ